MQCKEETVASEVTLIVTDMSPPSVIADVPHGEEESQQE
jgi:hypothetical protein